MSFILRIKIKIALFLFLIFWKSLVVPPAMAQNPDNIGEITNDPLIRTVLFYRSGWDLSMPVILMEEDELLEFRFDYLGAPEYDFNYSVAKCRYDWQINDISEHYYLEGFNDLPVHDYEPSRNTTQYYTHYSLMLPNDDLELTKSGNYILRIYDSSDPDSILILRRFALVDRKVEIQAVVNRPDREHQELLVRVNLKNLRPVDAVDEIKMVIIKNYDWNNKVVIRSKPVLRERTLHYDMPGQIVADGGNEFRSVDTKDPRFIAHGIENIEYSSPHYNFILLPEKLRQYDPYFSDEDLNGRSFYETPQAVNRHLDSDYVNVDFKLESPSPLGSDVYIYGALTEWKTDEFNYMQYNAEEGMYEARLLLKQGMLNYAYALKDYNSPEIRFDITEGNHDETENDYLIFVYFCSITGDFDELVGYKVVNSTEGNR